MNRSRNDHDYEMDTTDYDSKEYMCHVDDLVDRELHNQAFGPDDDDGFFDESGLHDDEGSWDDFCNDMMGEIDDE